MAGPRRPKGAGEYVRAADQPAGPEWCEVIVHPSDEPPRHCYTYARFERDGRRVCGLHRRRTFEYGPTGNNDGDRA